MFLLVVLMVTPYALCVPIGVPIGDTLRPVRFY